MDKKLKKIIFKKLYEDLSHVEIIPHNDSVWFIDRDNKYWYFEYKKNGVLYWNHPFFISFFKLFSLKKTEFEPIISDWVEEVLNCKVVTPRITHLFNAMSVEEVLNCKVVTPSAYSVLFADMVEEVLNCKVVTLRDATLRVFSKMEEVLNCKVVTPGSSIGSNGGRLEEVLNYKVVMPTFNLEVNPLWVEKVLNYEKQI